MDDRLKAFGAGAGQAATAGWQDEAVAKLLSAFPVDDGTGIPRQYAAGSAEEDLKKTFRAEDADLQRRFPANYTAGSLVGAAPAAIATGGAGGLGAVAGGAGLGALSGAGFSENKGAALAKDAIRGGAIGGGAAAAGNAASSAAKIAAPVLSRLWKQGPPPSAPQPAMAMAGARPAPRPQAPQAPAPANINMTEGGDRLREAAYKLGGNQTRTRVRLADLQKEVPDMPREQMHEELLRMQDEGDTVLYRIDDPTDVRPADDEFGLKVAGYPRHIAYLEQPPPSVRNAIAPKAAPARPQSIPPSSLEAAEVEARAALRRAEAIDELRKRPFRPDSKPLDHVPSSIPEHENLQLEKTRFAHKGETADAEIFRRKPKAVQTEASVKKSIPARPGAKKRAAPVKTLQDDLGLLEDRFAEGKITRQQFDELTRAAEQRHAPKGDAPAQTGAIQKLQEQGPPSDPRRVYLSTDEIDPEQLAQGRLASVQGASSSADIGNVYPRRYLLETDWQGQPIDYTNPSDQGFAGGMRGVRRTLQHGDDVQQSPGIARMAPASGPLKDLGFPETLDANINSAGELADTVLGHWQKQLAELRANPQPGPKFSPKRLAAAEADLANPELRQRLIDAYQKEGTRLMRNYAYDNEVLLDGGLNLGPNTRILDKQTGQSLPLAEFMQQSLGNLAKK